MYQFAHRFIENDFVKTTCLTFFKSDILFAGMKNGNHLLNVDIGIVYGIHLYYKMIDIVSQNELQDQVFKIILVILKLPKPNLQQNISR